MVTTHTHLSKTRLALWKRFDTGTENGYRMYRLVMNDTRYRKQRQRYIPYACVPRTSGSLCSLAGDRIPSQSLEIEHTMWPPDTPTMPVPPPGPMWIPTDCPLVSSQTLYSRLFNYSFWALVCSPVSCCLLMSLVCSMQLSVIDKSLSHPL